MSGHDLKAILASRLAVAYAISLADAMYALDETTLTAVDPSEITFERQGDTVLLIHGGLPIAELDLCGALLPVAPACDTLDPYGDRDGIPSTPRISLLHL